MKIWKYNRCGSCRKAIKYLDENSILYTPLEMLDNPPNVEELTKMLGLLDGNIKKLFNTSGVSYREGNYKEVIKTKSESELLELLASNGALIKRPFILGDTKGTVGFKEDIWDTLFK
ncbi:MAG: Spx/MgsR family RNA polymerase-binding regulatory protein [Spirochaetaceae bacterium]